MSKKDVTELIKRLERFEQRTGIRVEGLSAFAEEYDGGFTVTVRGEAHSIDGDEIKSDSKIEVSLLDKSGRVVVVGNEYLEADSFFGFQTLDVPVELSGSSLAKICIVSRLEG